jgi:hypothetical protein
VTIFTNNHGFSLYQVGLSFLGILIGMLVAIASNPIWHKNYLRLIEKQRSKGLGLPETEPEFRLPP